MARRYSAGRIFLQVVPSFKNLQQDIGREVRKANRQAEGAHEEAGRRNEEAANRGRTRARKVAQERELTDLEKFFGQQRRIHDKFHQGLIASRVKAGEAERAQLGRNFRARMDLAAKAAVAEDRARKLREKLDRESAGRNVKNAMDLAGKLARAEAQARRAREKADAESAGRNLRYQMDLARRIAENERKQRETAAREAERARREEEKAAEQAEERNERARARVRNRRAQSRLRDMRAADAERERIRGGGSGQLIRKASKAAADTLYVNLDADPSRAERKVAALRERLMHIDAHIGVDMDAGEALTEIKLIQAELDKLARKHPDVKVEANVRLAMIQLKRFEEQIDQINRKKATSGLMGMFGGITGGADQGANSFRIFNYRVLALLLLLPTLAPLLASAGAALGAIGTAAIGGAAGLAVMIVGFTGLSDAVTALGDVQKNAAKDNLANEKAIRSASRGVRDASQGVVRAREQAARAAEDSNRRIAQAERSLADAQKDAKKAQDDLREARAAAQKDQQDLADKIASGKLDERQALIDLFNAQVDYNAAMADGGATNLEREQASIQLERARLSLKGIREENAALATQQKKGVEQDQNVVAAQQRVADTAQRVKDAQQGVADAQRDARQQAADSAIAIRDANERLTDAQASYQEALTKTGDIGQSSMQKLNDAMSKLGPAGQEFARFLFGLQGKFYKLREVIQAGMLPPLQKEITTLLDTYGPSFMDFIRVMATTVGKFFTTFGKALRSPVMKTFFETMAKYAPTFFTQFGDLFINLMKIIAGLATAFAPFAKDFMDMLVKMSAGWADWAEGLKDSQGFQDFLAYVKENGPKLWQLFKDIVSLVWNIGKGLSETGIFDMLLGVFNWLANLDPKVVATIATVFTVLALASQIAAGLNALAISLSFLMSSALGPWVLLIVAIAAAMVWLYNNNEDFRKGVDFIWAKVKEIWKNVVIWVRNSFVPWLSEAWDTISRGFTDLWGYLVGAWNNIGKPLFDIIAGILTGDFVGAWDAAVRQVSSIWESLTQLFRDPINWVIDVALNKGLFAGINSIFEFLGIDTRIPMLDTIPYKGTFQTTPTAFKGSKAKNEKRVGFDTGGYTGPGAKFDVAGIVHADEFVLRKEATNKLRKQIGLEGLNFINQYGVLPGMPGYAIGGMVKPVNAAPRFPWGHYPSGKVHRALDLPAPAGTPIVSPFSGTIIRDGWDNTGFGNHVRLAADNGTFWILGHMLREIVSVGQRMLGGQLMGYVGSTGHSTGNHLHLEGRTDPYSPSSAFDFTSSFNGGVTRTPPAGKPGANLPWWADRPLEFMRDLANGAVSKITTGGVFGDMLRGTPNLLFDGFRGFLSGVLGSGDADLDAATGGKFLWNGREVADNGAQMFDNGGLLQPGVTQVLNMTGRPEPVFTADQWASRGASGPAALIGHLEQKLIGADVTPNDVVDELMYAMTVLQHGGKYAHLRRD